MGVPEIDSKSNHMTRIMTWNKLKDYLPVLGYTIEQKRKRIDNKVVKCYFITGEWHDVEIDDAGFVQLAEA